MENKKSKKKIIQFSLIGVMLVLIAVTFIMLAVIENNNEHVMTYNDYLKEGDKQLQEGNKEEAYKNYMEAYLMNKQYADDKIATEIVLYKIFSVADEGEKLVFAYYFLDLYTDEDVDNKEYNDEVAKYVADFNGEAFDSKPVFKDDKVFFGAYPQSQIKDEKIVEYLSSDAVKYDAKGNADVHGKKIVKLDAESGATYYYVEKIQWNILLDEDGTCFMVADKALDCEKFLDKMEDSAWSDCDMRKWLNEDFAKKAFTDEEYKQLVLMNIKNPDNYCYGTSNGEDTEDYIAMLSCVDLTYAKYGFLTKDDMYDDNRIAKCTEYASARGVFHDEEMNAKWWTNSNGSMNTSYVFVNCNGVISVGGEICTNTNIGVRPVITLKK